MNVLFNSLGECVIEGPEHASYGSVHVQCPEEARLRRRFSLAVTVH